MDQRNKIDLKFGMRRNANRLDQSITRTRGAKPDPLRYDIHTAGALPVDGEAKMDRNTSNMMWVALMERVRDQQDQAAFAKLFNHFAPRVKAFLIKSGASPTVAEDCAQDVMVTLWKKSQLFDPGRASVATWIFTIARNRRIDILRKENRPEPETLTWGPDHEPDAAEVLEVQQESDMLTKAVATLPEKQKKLILSAYYGDLSHSEIAQQTGLPLGTIKSRIRLALGRLRHAVK